MIAFGWGVWASAGRHRALCVVGGLLLAYGVIGLMAPFFPMHMRGAGVTLTDTMHKILTMVTVLLMLTAIGFGATAFGKWFRFYSTATIVILLVFGALTGLDAPRIEANLPTPWVGVTERIALQGNDVEKAWKAVDEMPQKISPQQREEAIKILTRGLKKDWVRCAGDVRQSIANQLAVLNAKEAIPDLLGLIRQKKSIDHECAE